MPASTGPNLGLQWGFVDHEDGWGSSYNEGFSLLDSVVQPEVLGLINDPPGSPSNGDRYIVGPSPTGAWSGHAGDITAYLTTGVAGWAFFSPKRGWTVYHAGLAMFLYWTSTEWLPVAIGPRYTYATPTSGSTVTVSAGVGGLVLEPASALASLTVRVPSSAMDGQLFELSTTQSIDSITVTSTDGSTVLSGSGVLGAGGGMGWRKRASNNTWYRRF